MCAVTNNQFGQATSSVPFWMNYVQCSGSEDALDRCSFLGWGNNYCNHATQDAGVICKSEDSKLYIEIVILFYILFTLAVGVVGVPYNIRLVESTATSLNLSWTVSI